MFIPSYDCQTAVAWAIELPEHSGEEPARCPRHLCSEGCSALSSRDCRLWSSNPDQDNDCKGQTGGGRDSEFLLPNQVSSPTRTHGPLAVQSEAGPAVAREEPVHFQLPMQNTSAVTAALKTTTLSQSAALHSVFGQHREEVWVQFWRQGKLILVAGLRPPPEFLLSEIARHTPPSPGGIIRRPSRRGHEMSEQGCRGATDVCTRAHPVRAQAVKAGLLGLFFFDPCAWQCCNFARAEGWLFYDEHACSACRRRACCVPQMESQHE